MLGDALGRVLRQDNEHRRALPFTTGRREFGVAAAEATTTVSTEAAAVAALYGVRR